MSGSCPSTCPPPHTRCRAHWVTAAQHVVREERANTVQEQECKKPPVRDTCQQLLLLESYSVCSIKLYHQVPARAGKGRGKEGEFSVCGRHGSGDKQTGQCLASSELAKPTKWVLGSCLSQRLPGHKTSILFSRGKPEHSGRRTTAGQQRGDRAAPAAAVWWGPRGAARHTRHTCC